MVKPYNFDAARSEAQRENMRRLAAEGRCFMCYENLMKYENNRVEFETPHWIITHNAYPYEGTKHHILLVARRHVKAISDLTKAERADLPEAIVKVEKHWQLDSYGIGMRTGDFRYNGASVEHLHAHIIVGHRDPAIHQPVRMKLASIPKDAA